MKVGSGVDTDPPLKALAKELRKADKELAKELAKVNQKAAEVIASQSRSNAPRYGRVEAKAADAIKAARTAGQVKVSVSASGRYPYALGAFLGAKQYKQFPDWVGNSWEPGGPGGPYAINQAIRDRLDDVLDMHAAAVEDFFDQAFDNAR